MPHVALYMISHYERESIVVNPWTRREGLHSLPPNVIALPRFIKRILLKKLLIPDFQVSCKLRFALREGLSLGLSSELHQLSSGKYLFPITYFGWRLPPIALIRR
jgi:hypothetical protein